jgi:hypothetical protein
LGVVFIFIGMVYAYMSGVTVSSATSKSAGQGTHLCRLSGLGYLCSRSGQKGHT